MTDYDFPAMLVELQVDFLTAMKQESEVAREMPSSVDVVAGRAEIDVEQQRALDAARAEQQRCALELSRHEFWREVDDPFKARTALRKLAQEQLSSADPA
ncbi:hypothetical protein [Microtetraspora malaysiensis]|uniref:Uncharacterized protein n=1 Tax=Microtetraspora malaysiensis TaxID=161358 RepID=A0ABW6SKL3_9ACTN